MSTADTSAAATDFRDAAERSSSPTPPPAVAATAKSIALQAGENASRRLAMVEEELMQLRAENQELKDLRTQNSELKAENEKLREALQKLKLDSESSVAKQIEKDAAPVTYHVTTVDGSETDIVLGSGASILDACAAAADWKGLPRMSVRLVVQGQAEPLPQSRTTKLCDAAGSITDLLLVITRFYMGEPSGPLVGQCNASEFLHYPASAYLADPSSSKEDMEMQLCVGHRIDVGVGELGFRGVMFCGTPDDGYTSFSPAMAGRVLVRAILHHHEHALGIGAGTSDSDLRRDPEYDKHFVGLYHGGVTRNVAAFGKRTHRSSNGWHGDNRLAVLFDMEKGTMQCYEELEPFGEEVQIGSDREFWPAVVLDKPGDSASIAVSYL